MVLMANRYILPAALAYLSARSRRACRPARPPACRARKPRSCLSSSPGWWTPSRLRTEALVTALAHEGNGDSHKHAKYMRDKIVPAMATLREIGDAIESLVPSNDWPLPTYREMLFIK